MKIVSNICPVKPLESGQASKSETFEKVLKSSSCFKIVSGSVQTCVCTAAGNK